MISPTLACLDYLNIQAQITQMDKAGVDFYHIDIMDGHFVSNLCLNFDLVRQIRRVSATPMDAHLMVENPMAYIPVMHELGIELACCHLNTCVRPEDWIMALKDAGIKAGFALSPADPIESILPYLPTLDYVLVLFVNPGYYGQSFQCSMLDKVKSLAKLRQEHKLSYLLEGDGGVGWDNIDDLIQAGLDIAVAGVFAVFGQQQGLYAACRAFRRQARSLQERRCPI